MRLTPSSLALAAALACVAPAGAGALQLGTTDRPTALTAQPCDQPSFTDRGYVYYQPVTLFGLPSSQAPSSGSITSWRTDQFGSGEPGATIALVIVHPTRDGVQVVAADVQTLPATITREDIVFTPARPIGIAAGDFIGIWGPDDRAGCSFSGGRSTEAYAYAEAWPQVTVGGTYRVRQQSFNRVNVAAELAVGAGGPPPPPPPPPLPPEPPRFDSSGRPVLRSRGDAIEVGTGQSVGCPDAGPCRVVTTAVTYFGTGGVYAASATARRGARARRRGRARRARPVVIGRRVFTVAPGGSAQVTFLLNRAGKRALRRFGRLRVTVTTTVTQGAALPVVARRTFTIRAPRAARRRGRR